MIQGLFRLSNRGHLKGHRRLHEHAAVDAGPSD